MNRLHQLLTRSGKEKTAWIESQLQAVFKEIKLEIIYEGSKVIIKLDNKPFAWREFK